MRPIIAQDGVVSPYSSGSGDRHFFHSGLSDTYLSEAALKSSRSLSYSTAGLMRVGHKRDDPLYSVLERQIGEIINPPYKAVRSMAEGLYKTLEMQVGGSYGSRVDLMHDFKKSYTMNGLERYLGEIGTFARSVSSGNPESARRRLNRYIDDYGLKPFLDGVRDRRRDPLGLRKYDQVSGDLSGSVSSSPAYSGSDNLSSRLVLEPSLVADTLKQSLYETPGLSSEEYLAVSSRIERTAPSLAERVSRYVRGPEDFVLGLVEETEGMTIDEALSHAEKRIILSAVENAGFDMNLAAEYLGDSRRTLDRRIKVLRIREDIEKARRSAQSSGLSKERPDVSPAVMSEDKSGVEALVPSGASGSGNIKSQVDRMLELELEQLRKLADKKSVASYLAVVAAQYDD